MSEMLCGGRETIGSIHLVCDGFRDHPGLHHDSAANTSWTTSPGFSSDTLGRCRWCESPFVHRAMGRPRVMCERCTRGKLPAKVETFSRWLRSAGADLSAYQAQTLAAELFCLANQMRSRAVLAGDVGEVSGR